MPSIRGRDSIAIHISRVRRGAVKFQRLNVEIGLRNRDSGSPRRDAKRCQRDDSHKSCASRHIVLSLELALGSPVSPVAAWYMPTIPRFTGLQTALLASPQVSCRLSASIPI